MPPSLWRGPVVTPREVIRKMMPTAIFVVTRSTLASELQLQVNFAGATWWHTGIHFSFSAVNKGKVK